MRKYSDLSPTSSGLCISVYAILGEGCVVDIPSFGVNVKLLIHWLLNVRQVKDPYSSYEKKISFGSGNKPTLNKIYKKICICLTSDSFFVFLRGDIIRFLVFCVCEINIWSYVLKIISHLLGICSLLYSMYAFHSTHSKINLKMKHELYKFRLIEIKNESNRWNFCIQTFFGLCFSWH